MKKTLVEQKQLRVSPLEEKEILERMGAMTVTQQVIAIRAFPMAVVVNEIERREQERIDLYNKLDELAELMVRVSR